MNKVYWEIRFYDSITNNLKGVKTEKLFIDAIEECYKMKKETSDAIKLFRVEKKKTMFKIYKYFYTEVKLWRV